MSENVIPEEWKHGNRVSLAEIERRLNGATLPERDAILQFIHTSLKRIRPTIEDDWLYESMASYFRDCIVLISDSQERDDSIHSPFEAANELVQWFNWINSTNSEPATVRKRIDQIAELFKAGDNAVKNCIETGFLEHALETPKNRPFFSHWKNDPILAESYLEALRWGESHTNPNAPT